MNIVIITDSSCDLPLDYITENKIPALGLVCNFKGKDYIEDFGKTLDHKEFYNKVREGEMPTTSQINSYRFVEEFEKHIKDGKSIIYLGFSSALSGTYNSALIAREEVLERYPNADITVIDTRSASMGVGLIVHYAYDMLNNGFSKEEIVNWVEDNKLRVNHWFTVDDLHHLKRGGRVSSASAIVGTLLNIKPVLHVNNEGQLIPVSKVKGRKKAIRTLLDNLKAHIVEPENQTIFISHGDCEEDALYLKSLIEKEYNVKGFKINFVGPVIGSHSGPGTLALFFIGDTRNT
ncbi:DegV family protein [Clostridium sp. MSJ-4]|uniref:DegV family protein n=1 Tax=Clostridium simiarum TaxID=2841506 RepID=A0ABS6F4K2_9CLOT|nr:DegV family protein [Clostridium simiarum]MBU5593419.1 DegV family protein [Clostridium simiarum]